MDVKNPKILILVAVVAIVFAVGLSCAAGDSEHPSKLVGTWYSDTLDAGSVGARLKETRIARVQPRERLDLLKDGSGVLSILQKWRNQNGAEYSDTSESMKWFVANGNVYFSSGGNAFSANSLAAKYKISNNTLTLVSDYGTSTYIKE